MAVRCTLHLLCYVHQGEQSLHVSILCEHVSYVNILCFGRTTRSQKSGLSVFASTDRRYKGGVSWVTRQAAEAEIPTFRAAVQAGWSSGGGSSTPELAQSFEQASCSPQRQSARLRDRERSELLSPDGATPARLLFSPSSVSGEPEQSLGVQVLSYNPHAKLIS